MYNIILNQPIWPKKKKKKLAMLVAQSRHQIWQQVRNYPFSFRFHSQYSRHCNAICQTKKEITKTVLHRKYNRTLSVVPSRIQPADLRKSYDQRILHKYSKRTQDLDNIQRSHFWQAKLGIRASANVSASTTASGTSGRKRRTRIDSHPYAGVRAFGN